VSENRYLVIEGVIGAGKTSLARMLSERLQAKLVLEEVEENPFLKDFYRDRARFAFQTQMHFLFSRYQQQRELRQQDLFKDKTVSDYLFQKDRIFANLNLSDKELSLYEKVVGWLELEVPRPDVVVYLQANTDTLMERVAKRGRTFEKDMDRQYMQALNDAYNYFFFHYREAPLLVVNTNAIDFVKHAEDLADLEARILAHRDGTTYYSPLSTRDRRKIARRAAGPPSPDEPAPGGPAPEDPPHAAPLFEGAAGETPPPPGAPAGESGERRARHVGGRRGSGTSRAPRAPRPAKTRA